MLLKTGITIEMQVVCDFLMTAGMSIHTSSRSIKLQKILDMMSAKFHLFNVM